MTEATTMSPVNLNDYWRVKLTQVGLDLHRADYDSLPQNHRDMFPYQPPVIDSDGFWKEQGWVVMRIMGRGMIMTCPAMLPQILIEVRE